MPASADPDLALQLAKQVADIYGEAAARLLAIVARRIANGITQPGWAERKLADVLRLRNDAIAVVDRLQRLGETAVRTAIEEAVEAGARQAAIELGLTFTATNPAIIDAIAAETVGILRTSHAGIVRSVLDEYRRIITDTAPGVLTGVDTRRQAAQRALDRFAGRGITGFVDRLGRRWEIETYAEMATRTAIGRAQVAGALDRYQADGRDLVIVSDAPQECSVCRPFEGKVLSISGTVPKGTRLDRGFTCFGSVGEARTAGLLHANCRHRLGAYVPGLTERMRDTPDPEGDEARQEQRRLERGVRGWRRRAAVAMDDTARRRAEAHVAEWRGRLREHVDANDLKRRPERERLGAR